jgi:hypothetical protein
MLRAEFEKPPLDMPRGMLMLRDDMLLPPMLRMFIPPPMLRDDMLLPMLREMPPPLLRMLIPPP